MRTVAVGAVDEAAPAQDSPAEGLVGTVTPIAIDDDSTIGETFLRAARRFTDRPFLVVPANGSRDYHPDGLELDYATAAAQVEALARRYTDAGYGHGHRVALFLENRPEHFLHKLALNSIGACCVPVNPDHRSGELAWLLQHARVDLVVVTAARQAQLHAACEQGAIRVPVAVLEALAQGEVLPDSRSAPLPGRPDASTAASVLYTSGTTGVRRAACCRTDTSWRRVRGTRPAAHCRRSASAATASTTRCRSST